MITDIFNDAIKYSTQDVKQLLKLGIVCFFSFLILPIFLQLGYSFRVTKMAVNGMINGGEMLPDFNDAISMFIDGLKVFVVKFVYILIPTVILFIFLFIGGFFGQSSVSLGNTISIIGIIVVIVVGILASILADLAVSHMAATDESLSTAFDFKSLWNISKSIGWLRLIGFYICLIFIALIISIIVTVILLFIFGFLGFISLGLGGGLSGIFSLGLVVIFAVFCFIVGPFLTILEARSVGLIYNLRE